jgi:competence protein ComEC
MRRAAIALSVICTLAAALAGQGADITALDIYIVDTEGGKATLFVSPSGQSLLIDSGNPGGRDTERIMAAVSEAGLKRIDFLLSTHYHVDHIGGMLELARRVPIGHFLDHGPNIEEKEQVAGFEQAYADLRAKARHTVVQPGFTVPISGIDWRIVTAAGRSLTVPLTAGGQPNPLCGQVARKDAKPNENNQSVGSVISHGRFRAVDLGDLVWDNEIDLMCPNNPIGAVDLYLVSHHGLDSSGSPALVHALRPRVAIMQNGTRKGASMPAMQIMHAAPGLEDIWQLHWSHNGLLEHNSAGVYIANMDEPAMAASVLTGSGGSGPGGGGGAAAHTPAYWIKVSALPDGSFTVTNTRNGFSKRYAPRVP